MPTTVTRRRTLQIGLALAGSGLVTGCAVIELPFPQQPRIVRVGYLGGGTSGPYPALLQAFRDEMQRLGYVESRTLVFEHRFIDGALDRAPAFAAELVTLKPDVMLGNGLAHVEALMRATTSIPIVGVPLGGDPVGTGVVTSLARPGGNVTGLSTVASGTVSKRLQLLRELRPDLGSVAVLWNANNKSKVTEYQEAQAAAATLGLHLHAAPVRGLDDLDSALQAIAVARADALLALADPLVNGNSTRIAGFAIQQRIPSMFELRDGTVAGGLMNYGPNLTELFVRAAIYVDKIVKGTPPADIPVEQPTVFDLTINLRTADTIGLTVPQNVLQQAGEILR